MRKYQPIWIKLKDTLPSPVIITAPSDLHTKIIRGVKKERTKDYKWTAMQNREGRKYRLMTDKLSPTRLKFYLVEYSLLHKL